MPRRKEGKALPDTPDMQAWRKEFDSMSQEEKETALKNLGLDDEELEEWREMEKGIPIEDELLQEGPIAEAEEPKKPKKTTKSKK